MQDHFIEIQDNDALIQSIKMFCEHTVKLEQQTTKLAESIVKVIDDKIAGRCVCVCC